MENNLFFHQATNFSPEYFLGQLLQAIKFLRQILTLIRLVLTAIFILLEAVERGS